MAMVGDGDCFAPNGGVEKMTKMTSKKKRKRGSLADRLAHSHLQPGPDSVENLFNYPVELVETIFQDAKRETRLRELLADGLVEHSDYSGISAEREAKRLLIQVLAEEHNFQVPHHVSKACDIDKDCQQVLVEASTVLDEGRSCVFTDIREQIHPEAQAFCSDVIAKAQADVGVDPTCLESAYSKIFQYLLQNSSWAVNQDRLQHSCCYKLAIETEMCN